jgi:hypothetical protein
MAAVFLISHGSLNPFENVVWMDNWIRCVLPQVIREAEAEAKGDYGKALKTGHGEVTTRAYAADYNRGGLDSGLAKAIEKHTGLIKLLAIRVVR